MLSVGRGQVSVVVSSEPLWGHRLHVLLSGLSHEQSLPSGGRSSYPSSSSTGLTTLRIRVHMTVAHKGTEEALTMTTSGDDHAGLQDHPQEIPMLSGAELLTTIWILIAYNYEAPRHLPVLPSWAVQDAARKKDNAPLPSADVTPAHCIQSNSCTSSYVKRREARTER